MAQVLKVNGRDLSSFIRVAHGEGMEPASADSVEPQFTGSPALGEGQTYVGDSLGNVAMSFPLILKAASTDALYQLIRDIRTDLVKGNTLEYSSGGATQSTFFDMESGKLEPNFEFWLDQNARCRAQLTIWRRPYGHTGTSRLIASTVGTGPLSILASGLSGDINGDAVLSVSLPSQQYPKPTLVFGVKSPVPTGWTPEWRAASIGAASVDYNALTTLQRGVVGASGRLASQAMGLGMGTNDYGPWALNALTVGRINFPPVSHAGRYRVMAGARGWFTGTKLPKLSLHFDPVGAAKPEMNFLNEVGKYNDLVTAGRADVPKGWGLVDLGEISVPRPEASQAPYAFLTFEPASGMKSIATTSTLGSYPLQIDGLYLIPLEHSAGVLSWNTGLDTSTMPRVPAGTSRIVVDATQKTSRVGVATIGRDSAEWLRGDFPTVPAASGGARIVVLADSSPGTPTPVSGQPLSPGWTANQLVSLQVEVRERFSYMR